MIALFMMETIVLKIKLILGLLFNKGKSYYLEFIVLQNE
jgi:hypothetical protein